MHVGEFQPEVHPEQGNEAAHRPGFTDAQWQTFLKMLETCKMTASEEKLSGPTYEDADWSG
ncbi:unnamed protein product [Cuscuta epithymum]|uniref:Uncharacterized protein n=1 Tax=Cuscuta epithymum TaxID=186058 RepID=A0AAV0D506_9ASTE|nr:unnamed protein product [Cuscuta epithymum]